MTADERIKQLLKRAGYPIMVAKNGEIHSIVRKFDTIKLAADSMTHSLNKGDDQRGVPHAVMAMLYSNIFGLLIREKDMADTIDRLEAALENALNERDVLLEEANGMCHVCKHMVCGMATDESKMKGEFQCTFEWCGVPDEEDADE